MAASERKSRLVLHHTIEGDPCPDLLVERNDDDKGVGEWVPRRKHLLLSQYIDAAWAPARKFSSWVFLDPFSGPGRIAVKGESFTRPGGSALAWRQSEASGTPFKKVLIGDISQERVNACAARLSAWNAPVEPFQGPAVDTVKKMVKAVPRGALCLAYIDPYNLQYLDFGMMKALASLPNVDFVVNFFMSDLRRNIDNPFLLDPVSPGWQPRIGADLNKANAALSFFMDWRQQIESLNFEFSKAMPTVENSKNSEMYRLVFFARHDLPNRLWKDVAGDRNLELPF